LSNYSFTKHEHDESKLYATILKSLVTIRTGGASILGHSKAQGNSNLGL